jgi:4-hydroxy-tetrahydrodipicolinate synthase
MIASYEASRLERILGAHAIWSESDSMTSAAWPSGVLTALVTPFQGDGIDAIAVEQILQKQMEAGVDGAVVCGGTGEFGALRIAERQELAEKVSEVLVGRLPFIVQTGALATRDTLSLCNHAKEVGAIGVMVASPFGEHINWRERLYFYEQVNGTVDLPIMIYNTPSAGLLSLAEVRQLANLENISAIKDSSGDIALLGDLLDWSAALDFEIYVGFDSLFETAFNSTARGVIFGSANVIPKELVRAMHVIHRSDCSEAKTFLRSLRTLLRQMENSPNYVALCKLGLRLSGVEVGEVREPYLMPSTIEEHLFEESLRALQEAFE